MHSQFSLFMNITDVYTCILIFIEFSERGELENLTFRSEKHPILQKEQSYQRGGAMLYLDKRTEPISRPHPNHHERINLIGWMRMCVYVCVDVLPAQSHLYRVDYQSQFLNKE